MIVVDLLSKMEHFVPCKESQNAAQLADLFWREVFQLHVLPEKIISDRGSVFVSKFWRSLMNSLGIRTGFSTAYHPQTDGQTERTNQALEDYLWHFCSYYQDYWDRWLDMAEFSLNNLNSSSWGVSPFFFSWGYHPKAGLLTEKRDIRGVVDLVADLQLIHERAIECLTKAKATQAFYYNKHRTEGDVYEEGDLVLIQRKFIQSRRINSKLDYRYIGPFKVLGMVGTNAVRVDVGREYPKLHPVFNVSLVARYKRPGDFGRPYLNEGMKDLYHSEQRVVNWSALGAVLDARVQGGRREFLLRWLHSTPGEDTWVLQEHIPSSLHGYLKVFQDHQDQTYSLGRGRRRKKK